MLSRWTLHYSNFTFPFSFFATTSLFEPRGASLLQHCYLLRHCPHGNSPCCCYSGLPFDTLLPAAVEWSCWLTTLGRRWTRVWGLDYYQQVVGSSVDRCYLLLHPHLLLPRRSVHVRSQALRSSCDYCRQPQQQVSDTSQGSPCSGVARHVAVGDPWYCGGRKQKKRWM